MSRREAREIGQLLERARQQLDKDAKDVVVDSVQHRRQVFDKYTDLDIDAAGDQYISEHVDMMRGK